MAITQANIADEFMRARRLQEAGRWRDAADLWRVILAAAPNSPEARGNFAGVLAQLGDLDSAEAQIRQALVLQPGAAWAHYQLGRILHLGRRFEAADASYRASLAAKPDDARARLALAHLHLAQGRYAEAWPLYDARKTLPDQGAPPLPFPNEWQGEPLSGRSILVWPEQGFGDQIQFARFAPALARLGADVTLAAPRELAALFGSLGLRIVPQAPAPSRLEQDCWTLLLSIPGRLGTTLESLPSAPYLAAPEDRRQRWRGAVLAPAVGLVWRGRASHPNDRRRSLRRPEPLLAALESAGARVIDLTWPAGDFADLAAIVEQLDLVVTVDTAIAHLAGALGKRAYVLLPHFNTDWRWLEGRSDSPWYPSLSLFRQPRDGDWKSVIGEVAAAYRAEFGS